MVIENNSPPQMGRLRRASIDDIPEIEQLINSDVKSIFGEFSLGHLIELSVLSICQLDPHEAVIGFLALTDHPNMPAIHPSAWEKWLWYFYKRTEMNARNTLFVHAACWLGHFVRLVLPRMLRSVFEHDVHIHHVVILMQPGSVEFADPVDNLVVQSLFQKVPMQVKGLNSPNLQFLYIAQRVDVCPRMRIRKAVEEDNDDLVPILDRQCDRLKELYGEFYISELIARHPESDRVLLVAEHNELAAGVMCLNTAVDYDFLNRNYNLAPFWGLRKKTDQDVSAYSGIQVLASKEGATKSDQKDPEPSSLFTILDKSSQIKDDSINQKLCNLPNVVFSSDFGKTSLVENIHHDLCNQGSLEFDIINIEKHLMEVPKFLSYDNFQTIQNLSEIPHDLMMKKRLQNVPAVSYQQPVVPENPPLKTYRGLPNAFMIELFAIREDIDERHGFDILEVTFELFPTLEYCIITIPTKSTMPLLLKHFSLVSPRGNNCVTHSLYVIHRNSVDGLVRVRSLEEGDWSTIEKLTSDPQALSAVRECYRHSYVLLCRSVVIGLAILELTKEPLYLRARYLLSEYRTFSYHASAIAGDGLQAGHGTIKVLLMSPAFQPHAQFFARELLRHSELTALYWTSTMDLKQEGLVAKRVMSIIGEMVPIRPMHSNINYNIDKKMQSNKYLEHINKNLVPLSLWLTTARLLSLPKVDVNRRIVVIGASRAALSFLEALLFGPASSYLNFTNVTLVSKHALPVVLECLQAADVMCPHKGRYDDRQIKSLPFHYYLDVVHDVMVRINRSKQYVVVSSGNRVYYDELVLTCGVQYQMPDYLKELREAEEQSAVNAGCAHTLFDVPRKARSAVEATPAPKNVFLVNDIMDAHRCLLALTDLIRDTDIRDTDIRDTDSDSKSDIGSGSSRDQFKQTYYTVMVYGATAAAYCCVSALLEFGVPAACILFVEPFPPHTEHALRINFFNNEYVDVSVNRSMVQLGVRVYRRHYLHSWQLGAAGRVLSVRLLSHYRELDVPCKALFYYGTRGVDLHAFSAINNCGLVYDGGVAVNEQFATNDPRVLAAGTCTRPPRALRNHNSEDIGPMLADIVLKRLDPFVNKRRKEALGESTSDLEHNSPRMVSSVTSQKPDELYEAQPAPSKATSLSLPIVTCCTFPGGLHYLRVRPPARILPAEVVQAMDAHAAADARSKVLETWNGGYFSVRVSAGGRVCDITCLRRSRELDNLRTLMVLYNKHERLLGNLLARFEANMIDDLFEYFSQPWMYALFHETFNEMLQDMEGKGIYQSEVVPRALWTWLEAHEESLGLYATQRLAADYRYV